MHEIKFDGYRLQAHIKDSKIKLFTRNANDWTAKFNGIEKALHDLGVQSAIFDGEAVVMDEKGRSNFGELQNVLSTSDQRNIKIFIFDLLFLNGKDLRGLPLKVRKVELRKIIPKKHPVLFYSEDVAQNGEKFFKMSCEYGLEGIVSKDNMAPYTSGRTRIWCKSKCGKRQEFVIGGFTTGKGNRVDDLGALLLGVYEKNKFIYVGKVGSGFNFQTLKEIKKKVSKLEIKHSAFDQNSPKGPGIHWIKPKLVAEITFSNWTTDMSLRNPVFMGLREDKNHKEIIMEKETHLTTTDYKKISLKQKELMNQKTKKPQKEIEVENVELTHPEKIIFPEEKINKAMIADYYQKVENYMLPFVMDRPLSLLRCPSGVTKKCFYQKHPGPGNVPKNFKSFKVREKSDTNLYTALDSGMGLRQLVQMNAFEIHVWNCHYQNLMHPDQIVMDFDPDPSVSFSEVVDACFEMKKTLDKLKLKSFVKLTGGKGVHIHIPIEPNYTWDEVKSFSKALADELVSKNPKKYLSTMSKELRKGKIFIDYLRNGYGSTAVAPYALRARSRSAIALPVEWSELKKIKSSDQFTIKKALLKIKNRKSDPWKKLLTTKQTIAILE